MEGKLLEKTLLAFIDKEYDVLVSTNIIETGLDIPNANTMIINNAHQFGLSDLHQLRGRVGRSNQRAFCYLFAPPLTTLTVEARKRLKTLEEFTDLGSGFDISMRDLDIRGAGNLLGAEQSGFITDIGYETYQKILEEAIYELKETQFKEMFTEEMDKNQKFVRDVEVDTDIEMLIPSEYIEQTQERLNQYTYLDRIDTEEGITKFKNELIDRYGRLPRPVTNLFEGLRLRWLCKALGFERFSLKGRKMRCFFVSNPQSGYFESHTFNQLLQYVSQNGHKEGLTLKQTPKHLILIKDDVKTLKQARKELEFLKELL
jgi:transcription-repair coupling factor (superfamily II helicase)